MINIEKIHYSDKKEKMETLTHKGWSLVLSKIYKEIDLHIVSINLMNHDKLIEYIKDELICQVIIVDLRLNCNPDFVINYKLNLESSPEIDVLIHLLFTRFEVQDRSYPIKVAIEMIKRKSFQKNANNLKNYFEVFKLICYIRKNIYKNVTVESVARYMLMSQSTLRRFCIRKMGKSAGELIRDIRLTEAIDLLESTDESVAIIAEKLNFYNSRTFSAFFQQKTGYTPKAYRSCYHQNFKGEFIEKVNNCS
ncbi:helix-turn-helix transcriptional regulator [Enterococcus faecalis]|nr:helix-turn-helix transcriptional regulator [Enterococcus faecalis]